MKILTIGNITQDITLHTTQGVLVKNLKDITQQKLLAFELGAKINVAQADFDFGGGAANSAVNFANLGFQVSTWACVGKDVDGEKMIKNLKEKKVKTNLIQQIDNLLSPVSFIVNATNLGDEHTIYTYRGANEELKIVLEQLIDFKFDLIYLTSICGRHEKNNLANIFRYKLSKLNKVKIAWNPGSEQIKKGLGGLKNYLNKTDFLMLNKDEAIEMCLEKEKRKNLVSAPQEKINNPRNLLKKIAEVCQGIIVITDGANGAYAYAERQIYFVPALKIKTRDTTGVGDAFNSTFTWAMMKNCDIQRALKMASSQAASVLQQVGAQNGLRSFLGRS